MNGNTQFSIKAGNFPCVCSWWAKVPLVGFFNRWTTYQHIVLSEVPTFTVSRIAVSMQMKCSISYWQSVSIKGNACTFLKYGKKCYVKKIKTTLFSSQDLHWREHLKKCVVATCCLTLHLQISHWEAVLEQNQICNLKQKLGSILHITWLALFIHVEV